MIINSIVLADSQFIVTNDFGDHASLVLHGLRSNERVETYELD